MLKMTFVENNPLTDLELRLIRFVNSNIVDIINSIMDMISDGFDMAYYFPREYYRKNKKNCNEFIYDLRNTLNSHVIYESLTPLQSYVLFYIIDDWIKINSGNQSLLKNTISDELRKESYESKGVPLDADKEKFKDKLFIIEKIENVDEYLGDCFEDTDFLEEEIRTMVELVINGRSFILGMEIDELDNYIEVMPRDVYERYIRFKEKNGEKQLKESNNELYDDIIFCAEKIQCDSALRGLKEDKINKKIKDLLEAKGYLTLDQTQQGKSLKGKEAGEIDILIKVNNFPVALIEAMKLKYVDKDYICKHIQKIYKYDTLGYSQNYLISYVDSKRFENFSKRYNKYIKEMEYPYAVINFDNKIERQYSELRTYKVKLKREGIDTILYHILIHMQ